MLLSFLFEISAQERLMVPTYFNCKRDLVTSWTGVVSNYIRHTNMLYLEVSTDANTIEHILLKFDSQEELLMQLYMTDLHFKKSDWRKIESEKGVLRNEIGVTVWLCDDKNTKALINWLPR